MQTVNEIMVREATIEDAVLITEFQLRMAFETEDRACNTEILLAGVRNSILDPSLGLNTLAYVIDKG